MSRGLGNVQRRVKDALLAAPVKSFTNQELASIVFAGEVIERKHEESIRRAIQSLAKRNELDVFKFRAGKAKTLGWKHRIHSL